MVTKKPKIICITGGKGGTGKTLCAVNIATMFKNEGYNVLLVDGDVENPNTHLLLNAKLENKQEVPFFKPNTLFNPSKLLVDVHPPNGAVVTDSFHWTSTAFRSDRASSPRVPVTEPGTYRFSVRNDALWDWNGFLTVNVQIQRFEKPYFYGGIAGFIIAIGYVVLVTASTYKSRHQGETSSVKAD